MRIRVLVVLAAVAVLAGLTPLAKATTKRAKKRVMRCAR